MKSRQDYCHSYLPMNRLDFSGRCRTVSVLLSDMPNLLIKQLPRYPSVPVARLGRLAVDWNFRQQRLGAALLWDAILRATRSEIGVFAVVVDAKDEAAKAFYRHFGFLEFGSLPNQLIFSLSQYNQSLKQSQDIDIIT